MSNDDIVYKEYYENEDILITDPMYILSYKEDWPAFKKAKDKMSILKEEMGFKKVLCANISNDVDEYEVYQKDMDDNNRPKNSIGEFCTDSGHIGIFSLEEVKIYHIWRGITDYNYKLEHTAGTCTLIKNFTGTISLSVKDGIPIVDGYTNIHIGVDVLD